MSCSAGAHLNSSGVARIPLFKPAAQYGPLLPELKQRLGDVLDGGEFILGPNVRAFEEEAAAYLGVPRTIGVANGTDAIVLVLRALEIGPGDEVVCPAFTFYATAEAIASVGATPVFADIDPATLNLDEADVERRVTPKTRAIMPVHLFGRPAALEALCRARAGHSSRTLRRRSAPAASRPPASRRRSASTRRRTSAVSATAASSRVSTTSSPSVCACCASTARTTSATSSTSARTRGWTSSRRPRCGSSSSTSTAGTPQRREAAARYAELGLGELVELPADDGAHVYHLYVVRSPERERIAAALTEAEIGNASYYVTPLHLQPALRYLGWSEGSLPETELAARENLALPMWAGIDAETQERVVATVRGAVTVGVAS